MASSWIHSANSRLFLLRPFQLPSFFPSFWSVRFQWVFRRSAVFTNAVASMFCMEHVVLKHGNGEFEQPGSLDPHLFLPHASARAVVSVFVVGETVSVSRGPFSSCIVNTSESRLTRPSVFKAETLELPACSHELRRHIAFSAQNERIQEFRRLPHFDIPCVRTTCHLTGTDHTPCLSRFKTVTPDLFFRGHDPPPSPPFESVGQS